VPVETLSSFFQDINFRDLPETRKNSNARHAEKHIPKQKIIPQMSTRFKRTLAKIALS
jgi:hypothetical protein